MLIVEDVVEQRLGLFGRVRDTLRAQVRSAACLAGVEIGTLGCGQSLTQASLRVAWATMSGRTPRSIIRIAGIVAAMAIS